MVKILLLFWIFLSRAIYLILAGVFLVPLVTLNLVKRMRFLHCHVVSALLLNTEEKRERTENLKLKFSKFQFKKQLIECGIKKHLSALLQEIGTSKTISNDNSIHSNSLSKQSKIL